MHSTLKEILNKTAKAEKNVITAGINSMYTITSSTAEKLTLANNIKVGDKLSIKDGSIIIGKNIKCIKVSAQVVFSVATVGTHVVTFNINDTIVCSISQNLTANWQGIITGERLIEVTEGDKVSLYVRSVANDKVNHALSSTFITVEAVA